MMNSLAGLLFLVLIMALASGGSMLPVWLFLTSLSIIAHTILFSIDAIMEPFVVLKTMLKYLRLDLVRITQIDQLDGQDDEEEEQEVELRTRPVFILAGYDDSYRFLDTVTHPVQVILALSFTLWTLCMLKDLFCIGSCCEKQK